MKILSAADIVNERTEVIVKKQLEEVCTNPIALL
jgi:hypothetical protein